MSKVEGKEKKMTVREKTEYNLVLNGMSASDAKKVTDSAIFKMRVVTDYSINWDDPSGYWSNADQLIIGLYTENATRELFPSFNPVIE